MKSHLQNLFLIAGLLLLASVAWAEPCSTKVNAQIDEELLELVLDLKEGVIEEPALLAVKAQLERQNRCEFKDTHNLLEK